MTEHNHDENKLIAERRSKLDHIRTQGNAFPNQFRRSHEAAQLQHSHGEYSKEELEAMDFKVSVSGRILAKRGPFLCCRIILAAFNSMRIKTRKMS